MEVKLHAYLTSALYEDEWLTSTSSRRHPLNRRLSGPHSPDGEEENPCPCQESNLGLTVRSQSLYHSLKGKL